MLPQILFVLTYEFINPLAACGVLSASALISAFCMFAREKCGFVLHMMSKAVLAICAAWAFIQSEPTILMLWVTIYAVFAGTLTLSANATKRMSVAKYTDGGVVMTDKGSRLFQCLQFLSFLGLAIFAEYARRSMEMDSWIYFQMFVPSLYYWATMLWTILLIKSHIKVNGEQLNHYITRFMSEGMDR